MIQFNGQRSSEKVRLVSHQHPVVLLPAFLIAGLILVIGVAGAAFFSTGVGVSILVIVCVALAVTRILVSLYCWRRTLVLVSNERVAFFHQKGMFKREFFEASLVTIAQVSHKVEGLAQTIFGYGMVVVNTGDAESSIFIKDVPDPFDVQQEIQNVTAGA